ncbi:MAG: heme biosynthesis protein HemY [Dechloromonas sp.]|nr:heme biosynthesis protein HemY [Candidatus Dechloromonas phosphoritropha]MBP8786989.1 heme biosynthesis protein HemY [Azonexus sp.]MBP9228583.1 heme biosynthesis protein HemY [Azonexus sp.]
MRWVFWILALFAVAVAAALGARVNDGYVLLVLPPHRIEVSLNLFVLALVTLVLILYAALRTLALTLGLPRRVKGYRERRRRERAGTVFQDAVRLLFEGRFGQALKKATESYAAGTYRGVSALVAARAVQRMREPEKQQEWMRRALADDPRNEAAALMLEAEMMNELRRFDEALAVLGRFQGKQGRHIAALRLELRARQGTGDWDGVLKLVRQIEKRDALPPEVAREIKTLAHLENIRRRRGDAGQLQDYLRAVPAFDYGRRLVLAAARALVEADALTVAQNLIESALDGYSEAGWQPELVGIYGDLTGPGLTARIARAEDWLHQYPGEATLLLALGRMCMNQRLWGKAQSYIEASLATEETRDAHLALAKLCDKLERGDEANRHFRAAVGLEAR